MNSFNLHPQLLRQCVSILYDCYQLVTQKKNTKMKSGNFTEMYMNSNTNKLNMFNFLATLSTWKNSNL